MTAGDIRKAHADVQDAAKTAAQRAIDAGHALTEAKQLLPHGQWLSWLREHCALAERTAQLYMKIAKSGHSAELVAALGLQAAATELTTLYDRDYNPFAHCDDQGKHEWLLYTLFLARECGWHPEGACRHAEYLCQKQFKSPDDWLTGEGPTWRGTFAGREPSACFLGIWRAFLSAHRHLTEVEIDAGMAEVSVRVGEMPPSAPNLRHRRRKSESATVADLGVRS